MAAFLDAVAAVGIGKPVVELVPFKVKVTLLEEEEELIAVPKPLSLKLNFPARLSPLATVTLICVTTAEAANSSFE